MDEEDPRLAEAKSWLDIQRNLRNYLLVLSGTDQETIEKAAAAAQ
jgi:hypothetical protein